MLFYWGILQKDLPKGGHKPLSLISSESSQFPQNPQSYRPRTESAEATTDACATGFRRFHDSFVTRPYRGVEVGEGEEDKANETYEERVCKGSNDKSAG